jgi:hypothetical protein
MSDTSDQAVISRLHERRGVLSNAQIMQILDLLESSTRRTHGDVCNQARHMRELEQATREVRDAERTLTSRWANVWDSVRIAFTISRSQLRREFYAEQSKTHRLAAVVIRLLCTVVHLDKRLDRLEAAAGLPEYTPYEVGGGPS